MRASQPASIERLVKRPSLLALFLGLIPFLAMCFTVSLWDRVHPMVFGLPFNLFWLLAWIVLTSICMWAAYVLETSREPKDAGRREKGSGQ
jgi:membrane protein required for beta-lactamase induction